MTNASSPLRHALAASAVLALALTLGCASPPVHYYTLVAAAPASTAATPGTRAGFDFTLGAVKVPAQVNQNSLVLRQASGQLAVLDNELWAAPLGDELRNAFSNELSQRLGATDVTAVARDPARKVLQLAIDVQRFDLQDGNTSRLSVVWSARQSHVQGGPIASCMASVTRSIAGGGYAASVESQQRAIAAVAAQMAAVLAGWSGQGAPQCPASSIAAAP